MLHGKLDHLPVKKRQQIAPVLLEYVRLFQDEQINDFKGTNVIETWNTAKWYPTDTETPVQSPLCNEGGNADTSGKHAEQRCDPGKLLPVVSPRNIGSQKELKREAEI